MREKKTMTVGYSFRDAYVQIGYCSSDMEEPKLLDQIVDSGRLRIPVCILKLNNSDQWVFGEEAVSAGNEGHGTLVEDLAALCEKGEPVMVDDVPYMPEELLGIFIKKSMNLLHRIGNLEQICAITFVFPTLPMPLLQAMRRIVKQLPIGEHCYLIDEKESFYHFVMYQNHTLWNNDVMLLEAHEGALRLWSMYRVKAAQTTPFLVTQETAEEFTFGNRDEQTDKALAALLERVIQKRLVSCIFLTGHEFEGDWMQETKRVLCRGRKVFAVDYVAVRGACYRGFAQERQGEKRRFYLGEHQLARHLGLYVLEGRERQYCRLTWAGTNWYEANLSQAFLVDACDMLCLQLDDIMEDGDAKSLRHVISLDWLPKRPHLATKIRLDVSYTDAMHCSVTVTDIGLGELFPGSQKSVTEEVTGNRAEKSTQAGGLRICRYPTAKTPLYIKKISINLYTIEELCYYIYHNFSLIDDTFMNESLFDWMENELGMTRFSGVLRQNLAAGASYRKLASTLLDLAGYCSKDELRQLFSQIDVKTTRPSSQTLKTIGDRMLENHKYAKAIREYNSILHLRNRDSQSDEFLSSVYHNMGVAYAQLFLYDEAAKCFAAAYEKQQDPRSRELYLAAVKLGGTPIEDFLQEEDENVGETLARLVKEAAEDETAKQLHALAALKEAGDMEGYQKALAAILDEQKKKAGKYISV